MNPLIQSKNATILPVLIALTLGCLGLSPQARAVDPPPGGGYPNQNTAEDDDALFSLTTGADNTAMGFDALDSNTTGSDNAAGELDLEGAQAGSTPHVMITRRRCYKTAWSLLQGDLTAIRQCFRERRTVRPGERDLDCHGQPQHRTLCSHGDVATKRHGPCCRGI